MCRDYAQKNHVFLLGEEEKILEYSALKSIGFFIIQLILLSIKSINFANYR